MATTPSVYDPVNVIETTLLRGKVRLLQPEKGFHASLDTVFLAAATPVKDGWNMLDIGCGVGSAGLCVALRNKNILLMGIDIQQNLVDLAHQNARLNGHSEQARFFCGDISKEKHIENNNFHSVLINPPYQEAGTHTPSPNRIKAFAHGEDASSVTLEKWIKYSHLKLKNGFYLTMIHRADRLDDVINGLTAKKWFGSLEVIPLWPRSGDPAKRVIVRARKERYAPLKLHAGIVIHEKDGSYTKAAKAILEDGAAID